MNVVFKLESTDCALVVVMDMARVLLGSSGIGFDGCEFEVWGKGEEVAIVAMPDILARTWMCSF